MSETWSVDPARNVDSLNSSAGVATLRFVSPAMAIPVRRTAILLPVGDVAGGKTQLRNATECPMVALAITTLRSVERTTSNARTAKPSRSSEAALVITSVSEAPIPAATRSAVAIGAARVWLPRDTVAAATKDCSRQGDTNRSTTMTNANRGNV